MPHRRRPPFTDEHYHATPSNPDGFYDSRKTDYSAWYRLTENMKKYAFLYAIGASIFTTLGFSVVTPKRTSAELADKIAAINKRVDTIKAMVDTGAMERKVLRQQGADLNAQLGVLIRMACQDRFMTVGQKQLVGLLDNHGDCIR